MKLRPGSCQRKAISNGKGAALSKFQEYGVLEMAKEGGDQDESPPLNGALVP